VTLEPGQGVWGGIIVESNVVAEVFIDDVDSGYTTPTVRLRVREGTHKVEISDGMRSTSKRVTVVRGETVRPTLLLATDPDLSRAP
jgi:hypothetical protein